jgi:ankyrin repeat protein
MPPSMDEHVCSAFMRPLRFIVFALALTSGCVAFAGEIHEAVHENNVSKVKKLITENPDLVFSKDDDGFTPLHLAAANGYKEMAELLLASKSDVNSRDNAGSTPLHQAAAAHGQHSDLVEMLIAKKTDVNAGDKKGLTPLHYAVLANNTDVAKSLLTHGANANAKDSTYGQTPLIVSVGEGNKEMAELLLEFGAEINTADSKGTPLAWAMHTHHPEIAEMLRKHGGHE